MNRIVLFLALLGSWCTLPSQAPAVNQDSVFGGTAFGESIRTLIPDDRNGMICLGSMGQGNGLRKAFSWGHWQENSYYISYRYGNPTLDHKPVGGWQYRDLSLMVGFEAEDTSTTVLNPSGAYGNLIIAVDSQGLVAWEKRAPTSSALEGDPFSTLIHIEDTIHLGVGGRSLTRFAHNGDMLWAKAYFASDRSSRFVTATATPDHIVALRKVSGQSPDPFAIRAGLSFFSLAGEYEKTIYFRSLEHIHDLYYRGGKLVAIGQLPVVAFDSTTMSNQTSYFPGMISFSANGDSLSRTVFSLGERPGGLLPDKALWLEDNSVILTGRINFGPGNLPAPEDSFYYVIRYDLSADSSLWRVNLLPDPAMFLGEVNTLGYSRNKRLHMVWSTDYVRLVRLTEDPTVWAVFRDPMITDHKPLAYPNPASSVVTFSGLAGATISLYDQTGKRCLQTTLTPQGRLDVHGLPAGLYVWIARDRKGKLSQGRLILQR